MKIETVGTTKVRIPICNIQRLKNSFYKHLEVDESTRNAIKLYNIVKYNRDVFGGDTD